MTRFDNQIERESFSVLQDRYLSDGFQFTVQPNRELPPGFLSKLEGLLARRSSTAHAFPATEATKQGVGELLAAGERA